MRRLAIGTFLGLVLAAGMCPGEADAAADRGRASRGRHKKGSKQTAATGAPRPDRGASGWLARSGLRRPTLRAGTSLSGYRRTAYGKDETRDVAAHQRQAYHRWQDGVMHDLALPGGAHAPVAVVEVGPSGPKPTIVHLHGATVQVENVLLWRLARAFEAEGRPVRIIAPRQQDATRVIEALTESGGKVALMGHSAGSGAARSIAGRQPDKVSHYIGIGSPGAAGNGVKTLLLNGTNGRDGFESARELAARDDSVTALILDGVDHSMRFAPAGLPGGEGKARHNATPETARVARQVARSVVEFVRGEE